MFRPVRRYDAEFLWELLAERKPHQNISHRKMPTWNEHLNFILNHPYQHWDIIVEGEPIGAVYLTWEFEIGLVLLKEHQNKGYGTKALEDTLKRYPDGKFLANINPDNKQSIAFFKKHGFKRIQETYELSNYTRSQGQ